MNQKNLPFRHFIEVVVIAEKMGETFVFGLQKTFSKYKVVLHF